jgi:signal transduction histidine kinase
MSNRIVEQNEEERIKNLKKYNILDTPPDGSFDRITKIASTLLKAPISIISLVDTDRIWFKSSYGLDGVQEIGRDPGLCSSAILEKDFYMVEDAIKDPIAFSNPLVASEFGLRFYAAAPITTKEGYNLGTLCVIDQKPRTITEEEKEMLISLSEIVIDQMELRLSARNAVKNLVDSSYMLVHDLKSPFNSLFLFMDILKKELKDNTQIVQMCDMMLDSAKRSSSMLDKFLEDATTSPSENILKLENADLVNITQRVILTNQHFAKIKNIKINFEADFNFTVSADKSKLIEIIDNLINNAIKYSNPDTNIFIKTYTKDDFGIFEIKDEGQGFSEEDKKYVFKKFSKLSAKPTGGENSTGLGLWIVCELLKAHKGSIELNSDGNGKGTTFVVKLPLSK